jgi:hypothetical protein
MAYRIALADLWVGAEVLAMPLASASLVDALQSSAKATEGALLGAPDVVVPGL